MAVMKKAVKITGTAKSTSGSSASKNIKVKSLGSSSDKAQLKKASMPKRPVGELPKRLSKAAQVLRNNPLTLTGSQWSKKVSPSEAAAAASNARIFAKRKAASVNAMKTSARSHQADLARMSGDTAATKKFKADKKAGKMYREDKPSPAYVAGKKAERRTLKSFK